MTPRRILHCIPGMGGGGAERQLGYLSRHLVRLGWDVHVALVAGGPNLQRLKDAGATVHHLEARSNYDPRILWRLTRTMDRIRPDLVQVWLLQMEVLGALSARYRSVPWILSERCSEAAYPPSVKHRLRQWMARSANAIVSNSAGGDEYWETRVDGRVERYVIPNAVPLDEIAAVDAVDARQIGIEPTDSVVLFAGRLTEQKGPATMLEALVRVLRRPRTVAVMAGDGPLREMLHARARAVHISDRVHFTGYLDNLWSWMKRASVFVSPSLFEGHPNTVLEAAACGCPLVVSSIPAHDEFLDDNQAVRVTAGDSDSLGAAIVQVLDNRDDARKRAERAASAVEKWSAERIAGQYERVYLHVIEHAARRSAEALG